MVRLVLATRNAGKVTELRQILDGVSSPDGGPIELVGMDAFPEVADVVVRRSILDEPSAPRVRNST